MATTDTDRGRAVTEVSNALVRLHRERYGRGAVRARTIMQENYVVCFLDDIYTAAERTLIDAGRGDTVRDARLAFQDVMADRFKEAVAKATGRRVVAMMSQIHVAPDMAVEVFVLENPRSDSAVEQGDAIAWADGER